MRVLSLAILLLATAGPAAAQAAPHRDTTASVFQPVLLGLRDAVDRVSARVNEFRRDLRTVGDVTVLARAGRLETACRETRAVLADARPQLAAARLATHQVGARDTLITAIGILTASLQRECERGLATVGPGNRADTLRAWGPHRTAQLAKAVSAYHSAAGRFARRLGADLTKR